MPNELRIDVIGRAGTGKSTIIGLIADALRQSGFDTLVFSVDQDHMQAASVLDARAVIMAGEGTKIKIHEVQTARISDENLD